MEKPKSKTHFDFIGIGKTLYNSSCAYFDGIDLQVILTERLNKQKYSGEWPWRALEELNANKEHYTIAENRDVISADNFENALNRYSPFNQFLSSKGLEQFLSSDKTYSLSHHYTHALSSLIFSNVGDAIICVMDGAGSCSEDFKKLTCLDSERKFLRNEKNYEGISIYHYSNNQLECLHKEFFEFYKLGHTKKVVNNCPGMLFEYASEVIFGNKHDAGKVMGLAAFGKAKEYETIEDLIKSIEWERSFKGSGKVEWESSEHLDYYKELAASVQRILELRYLKLLDSYSSYSSNLILAGGAAMNCVSNMNLSRNSAFKKVLVSPCPGDEGISLGLIQYLHFLKNEEVLKCKSPYLGKKNRELNVEEVFSSFNVEKLNNKLIERASEELINGKVIGWFQGRSEIGARALGNRSILSRVDKVGLKSYLNEMIKFREEFRPYACSCLQEFGTKYFEVDDEFESPYMSFTIPIRESYKNQFKEVCHIDGTSRAQFVTRDINPLYYDLIKKVGEQTGVYALLNTSLNVMGQPIVEDLMDLLKFFKSSNVDGLFIGDYFVTK
ncbi:carbamoyltransferase C-terminal domain-containing protein [Halobacteriovorax marinus]|uniref:carbamoyltransferase C-terminal domain-containing protein n=1 Tax=Halobacteriovorax marinus TaxID=97084 RepID=UPI003A90F7C2